MRATFMIDDQLLSDAQELTGIKEQALLIKEGLRALIQRESAKKLAMLGGTEKDLESTVRRRPDTK